MHCTRTCVYVLLNAAVLLLTSAKNGLSPSFLIRSQDASLHRGALSTNGHFPVCPCFNVDCCKICTATEQLFIPLKGYYLCLLGNVVNSNLTALSLNTRCVLLISLACFSTHCLETLMHLHSFCITLVCALCQIVSPCIYQHHSEDALICCYDSLCPPPSSSDLTS